MSHVHVHNYWEQRVFEEVLRRHEMYPEFDGELLADVACVALNQLPVRYIRFNIDLVFNMSQFERADSERALSAAVDYAYGYVAERTASGLSPRQKAHE